MHWWSWPWVGRSELDAEANLELLDPIAQRCFAIAAARIQRHGIAQADRTEWQQQVGSDAGGGAQLGCAETVIDALPAGVEEHGVVRGVNVTDVEEETGAHPCGPTAGPRRLQVELARHEQISAIRVAETVSRAEPSKPTNGARSAREPVEVWRQCRRLAKTVAESGDGVHASGPLVTDRPVACRVVAHREVFDVARRQGSAEVDRLLESIVGEALVVTRVAAPAKRQIELVELGRQRAVSEARLAVRGDPARQLRAGVRSCTERGVS